MAKKKGFWQNLAEAQNEKQKRLGKEANQRIREQERIYREEECRRERANRRYCPRCRRTLIQVDSVRYYCEHCREYHEFPNI